MLKELNKESFKKRVHNYELDKEEHNLNKQLIQVIDIFGRDSKEIKNKPLFYIYDDGTVDKKLIFE
jgi:hypothetical protein